MIKYSTYEQAKKDITSLTTFVTLVEEYEVTCVDTFIINSYAKTSSIAKVIKELNISKYANDIPNGMTKPDYILCILKNKTEDPLQKIVHNIYKNKVKKKK